jgi:hypothetical protein
MNKVVLIYDDDGQIRRAIDCPAFLVEANIPTNGAPHLIVDAPLNAEAVYVDLSTEPPSARDKPPITPTVTGLTVTGLPIPCTVTVADAGLPDLHGVGTEYEVTDGAVDFSATLPGTYRLTFRALHHLPASVVLTVE